jgi:polar amino acid transport system substrate-binding protein
LFPLACSDAGPDFIEFGTGNALHEPGKTLQFSFIHREFDMRTFHRTLLGTLFAALAFGASTVHADALDDISKAGVLKVAVPQDFPPFGSVGPDLQPRGLDIDTAQLLADKLAVKLELTPVNSTNRIPFLTTGKVDLVISSLGKNPEREAVIDFSAAYAPFYLGVFGPEDAAIASLDDLAGKTISVTRGSIEDIELSKVAPQDATIKRFEDNNSTIAAYLSRQVELIASGNVVMVAIAERNPKRIPSMKLKLKDSPVYVGVNKNQTRSMPSSPPPRPTAASRRSARSG